MKKLLAIILAAVMLLSVMGCTVDTYEQDDYGIDEEQEEQEDPRSIAEEKAKSHIYNYVKSHFSVIDVNVTITSSSENNNYFKFYGKTNCTDKYGDTYSGNFDIGIKYYPDTNSYNVFTYDQDDLLKDK
jgi:hypothetical protein